MKNSVNKICNGCGNFFSKYIKKCPTCGKKRGLGLLSKIIIFILITSFIIGAISNNDDGYISSNNNSTESSNKNSSSMLYRISNRDEDNSAEALQKIDINQLIIDYSDNEVRADNKYKFKRVEICGYVLNVHSGIFYGATLSIGSSYAYDLISVHISTSTKDASEVSKGSKYCFKGELRGMILGNIIIDDGKLIFKNL